MLLKLVREGLGRTLAFIDRITRPTAQVREPARQREVDAAVAEMSLYQYFACPFCIKTRRAIYRLNLPIEVRNAQGDPTHRSALADGGGKIQVPCLRIDDDGMTTWMYESDEIIRYLKQRFA